MLKALDGNALRKQLPKVLNEVVAKNDFVLVTRKSKPTAALVSLDLFEGLLALTRTDYLKSIRQALADYKAGRTLTHRDVFGRI